MSNTHTGEAPVTDLRTSIEPPPTEPDASPPSPAPGHPPTRIQLTGAALSAIREMMAEEDLLEAGGLRLTARTGAGCSAPPGCGMVLEVEPDPDDRVLELAGVRLFLDPRSAWMLDGLVVDYVTSSPMGEGFAFRHGRRAGGSSC